MARLMLRSQLGVPGPAAFNWAAGGKKALLEGLRGACSANGVSYDSASVSDAGGPAVTPPHTPAASKSSLIGHFVTAEECLKLFPKRLRESFRVKCDC